VLFGFLEALDGNRVPAVIGELNLAFALQVPQRGQKMLADRILGRLGGRSVGQAL
jgi:hypothetical protein